DAVPSITTIAFGSTRHFDRVPLFIFRNSFVIPSLSGFSANKNLRIWAENFRLARDSDAIQRRVDASKSRPTVISGVGRLTFRIRCCTRGDGPHSKVAQVAAVEL